jgi:hypothetical protein
MLEALHCIILHTVEVSEIQQWTPVKQWELGREFEDPDI